MIDNDRFYRAQAVILARGVARLRPVLAARHGRTNTVASDLEYALALADGVAKSAERCARGLPFHSADFAAVESAAGSHWVMMSTGLWYRAACAVMQAARAMCEIYYWIGAVPRPITQPPLEIYGFRSEFIRTMEDFRAIEANLGDQISRAIAHDIQVLVNRSADSTVDPSDEGPLGPLWPDGIPDWLTDLRHQPEFD